MSSHIWLIFGIFTTVHVNVTCSATYLNPLSSLTHSKVSPSRGLKGLWPARAWQEPYTDTAKAATHIILERE